MSDYQLPLFSTYDLTVEFDKLVHWVRKTLRQDWERYSLMEDDDIPNNIFFEVFEIELSRDELTIQTQVEPQYTIYKFSIPFCGPEEMWLLYPVHPREDILGEVSRNTLILEYGVEDEMTAWRLVRRDLEAISQVLDQQAGRIAVFHKAKTSIIAAEVAKLRQETAPSCRIH